mmetsp:Transcript_72032/g.154203  ORF Transcript_72032/g.154203 Transcript_72032/m.154203 type:complete len:203 (-) Transcript_72032:1756-2364(-)
MRCDPHWMHRRGVLVAPMFPPLHGHLEYRGCPWLAAHDHRNVLPRHPGDDRLRAPLSCWCLPFLEGGCLGYELARIVGDEPHLRLLRGRDNICRCQPKSFWLSQLQGSAAFVLRSALHCDYLLAGWKDFGNLGKGEDVGVIARSARFAACQGSSLPWWRHEHGACDDAGRASGAWRHTAGFPRRSCPHRWFDGFKGRCGCFR